MTTRTRRPALIPHHSDLDLTLSLSAASAALRDKDTATVWVLPTSKVGEEFKKDVFSWVNSDELEPATVPTSPTNGDAEVLERQKQRLAAAAVAQEGKS